MNGPAVSHAGHPSGGAVSFCYSDAQWADIDAALRDGGFSIGSNARLRAHIRNVVENTIALWHLMSPDGGDETAALAGSLRDAAKVIISAANTKAGRLILDGLIKGSSDQFLTTINQLAVSADQWSMLDFPTTVAGHRHLLTGRLMLAWFALTGRFGTSKSADGQTPSGPLIRFLIAASGPAGVKLTEHQALAAVRFHRKQGVLAGRSQEARVTSRRLQELHHPPF